MIHGLEIGKKFVKATLNLVSVFWTVELWMQIRFQRGNLRDDRQKILDALTKYSLEFRIKHSTMLKSLRKLILGK